MFEMFSKEVEIDGVQYKLRPLSGRFIGKLYSVMKDFNVSKNMKEEDAIDAISGEAMEKLHLLAFETFKKSYPDKNEEELDEWVTQNLMLLIAPIFEINIKSPEEKK